jgi:hypothetical protein
MLDSAVLLHYAANMSRHNTPPPSPPDPAAKVRISVTLTAQEHAMLKRLAILNKRSTTKQATTLLEEHLRG